MIRRKKIEKCHLPLKLPATEVVLGAARHGPLKIGLSKSYQNRYLICTVLTWKTGLKSLTSHKYYNWIVKGPNSKEKSGVHQHDS